MLKNNRSPERRSPAVLIDTALPMSMSLLGRALLVLAVSLRGDAGVTVNTTAGPGLALGSAMNSHVNVTGSAGCSPSTPDADKVDCMGPPGADRDTCLSNANCCFDQAGTAAEPRRLPDGSDVPWCFRDPSQCGEEGASCEGGRVTCCSGLRCENRATSWNFCYPIE